MGRPGACGGGLIGAQCEDVHARAPALPVLKFLNHATEGKDMFTATHKQTGIETRGIPQDAEAHLLNTSLWCAARVIGGLVDFLVSCPNAVAAESAEFKVTRES